MTAVLDIPAVDFLTDLAETANREHALAQQSGVAMVTHAIRSGEALLSARQEIGTGNWLDWLRENFKASERLAQCYMRLAKHQDLVGGASSMSSALKMIANGGTSEWSKTAIRKARQMYGTGDFTQAQLAEEFGVSPATISRWLDKQSRQKDRARSRKERAARRALDRQKQEREARKVGGSIGEAYSLVRRALQALEAARDEAKNPEASGAVASAMQRLYGAEDEIGRAVRLWD